MTKKQLSSLFVCSLIPWIVGFATLPLVPVYATQLGASPAVAGNWLSFTYIAMAASSVFTGWLSDRWQRRKILLIIAGLASIISTGCMGITTTIWLLVGFTAFSMSCLGGMSITLTNTLAGLFAGKEERGRVFGILQMTIALGALVGGAIAGPFADRWGYPKLFFLMSTICIILPVAALFVENREVSSASPAGNEAPARLSASFWILIVASILSCMVFMLGHLTRSLTMNNLGFPSAGVSSVVAVGGAVTLPFPPLLGWLSDRFGRKHLLAFCFFVGAIGISLQAISASWWLFAIATACLAFVNRVGGSAGSAFVTDLVPQQSLGIGISLYRTSVWIAGIVGFSCTGYAIESFGLKTTMVAGTLLPLSAILLLLFIQPAARHAELAEGL